MKTNSEVTCSKHIAAAQPLPASLSPSGQPQTHDTGSGTTQGPQRAEFMPLRGVQTDSTASHLHDSPLREVRCVTVIGKGMLLDPNR